MSKRESLRYFVRWDITQSGEAANSVGVDRAEEGIKKTITKLEICNQEFSRLKKTFFHRQIKQEHF